jgi:hypothetical protein
MSLDRGWRGGFTVVSGTALLIALLACPVMGEEVVPEYQLKAEFMERFTRFIEWPAASPVNDEKTPFAICVAGDDPFGPFLRNLAATRRIKTKTIAVRPVSTSASFDGCHILFIPAAERAHAADIVRRTSDRPILTVSESNGLGQAGVMINFFEAADKVRFEINPRSAEKSGLRISSKLLKLAKVVGEE